MEGLCSIAVWESGLSDSAVSCEDILGYNVRLYHPESKHQNLTRRVEADKTYYKISDEDKDVKIDHETLVQVQYSFMHRHCRTMALNNVYDHDFRFKLCIEILEENGVRQCL